MTQFTPVSRHPRSYSRKQKSKFKENCYENVVNLDLNWKYEKTIHLPNISAKHIYAEIFN